MGHISGALRHDEDSRFLISPADSMTEPTPVLPTAIETAEVLRFLNRFADLMSRGSNSENLLRAAGMLETHVDLLGQTQELLQAERIRSDANAETHNALEAKIGELESEILALKSELSDQQSLRSEQQSNVSELIAEMQREHGELQRHAAEAEAALAALQDAPPAIPSGSIAVPLTTLRTAKAQFESLALAFEKSGNIVSQVMCEASASSIERVILDSGVEDDRSQHAA